jgi:hypothetical protein
MEFISWNRLLNMWRIIKEDLMEVAVSNVQPNFSESISVFCFNFDEAWGEASEELTPASTFRLHHQP